MKKKLSILTTFILLIVASHYYGVQRGVNVAKDALNLN